jgi:AmmeMemoRadiSam system protein A
MHPLVGLAKKAIEAYVTKKKVVEPPSADDPELLERAGVFVCLKKGGDLRGCIGTFLPCRQTVAEETIANAIAAATGDPRFPPLSPSELGEITYSVDVLGTPERVEGLQDLDPGRYGVIVACGGRRGLLLPDLEGVDTAEEQVRIARMKAGIGEEEKVDLFRFEVRRHV